MTLPVALQLYTVRDPLKNDFEGTLREVARIGYTHVELAGLQGHTAAEAKTLLDDLGLQVVAAHDGPRIVNDLPAALADAKTLGYDVLVWQYLGDDQRTIEGYSQVPAGLRAAAEKAPDYTFAYHNHAFEFDKLPDGRSGFDIIFSDPNVTSELDTAWVRHGGDDPVAWMEKLSGRLPILHIKDLKAASNGGGPVFTEVGTGVMDFEAILAAAPAAGVRFLVVEQDNNWIDGDSLKSAALSYEGLRKLLG